MLFNIELLVAGRSEIDDGGRDLQVEGHALAYNSDERLPLSGGDDAPESLVPGSDTEQAAAFAPIDQHLQSRHRPAEFGKIGSDQHGDSRSIEIANRRFSVASQEAQQLPGTI